MAPTCSIPTTAYVKPELLSTALSQRKWSDYSFEIKPGLAPLQLFTTSSRDEILGPPEQLVKDWKALDAFFRYLLFTYLKLPKPPLAQHILLAIPPNLPNPSRDRLTQLFFENLQAPAFFMIESPALQVLACNVTSGVTIDIGSNSTLIGYTCDSILVDYCCHTYPIGEQDCDDYLISLLLADDPSLPSRLGWTPASPPEVLYHTLSNLISHLKADGHVRFEPNLKSLKSSAQSLDDDDETGITDVAEAIVSGKADKIIGRQISSNGSTTNPNSASRRPTLQAKKLQAQIHKDTDTIVVSALGTSQFPLNSSAPTSPVLDPQPPSTVVLPTDNGIIQVFSVSPPVGDIEISNIRHRHGEPLFVPALLKTIPPVFARFGLQNKAKRYEELPVAEDETLAASVWQGLWKLNAEQRKDVSEYLVLTGEAGVMCRNEGLARSLCTQLQSLGRPMSGAGSGETFKPVKIPDYFSEFKGRAEWTGFLGGCIVAKLVFNDASSSKLWMSKPDYSKEGPSISRKIVGLNGVSS